MRLRLLAHLRGIKVPSVTTGLRGRRAKSVVLDALDYELVAESRRFNALVMATVAPRLKDGAARKAIKDAFHDLDVAGCLGAFRLDDAVQLHRDRSTVKVEKLYDALFRGGIIGKARIAESDP